MKDEFLSCVLKLNQARKKVDNREVEIVMLEAAELLAAASNQKTELTDERSKLESLEARFRAARVIYRHQRKIHGNKVPIEIGDLLDYLGGKASPDRPSGAPDSQHFKSDDTHINRK